ncbi:uncharacterized protein YpuA (DUF1002 family) [Virgibacillus natechei]|uniref:Uncharacterized protein YpuA (DUF1002 family) n=1 Tax=Virgibacillus natechei TaxID=1216297 RepID=A0ABS4IKH7_9BACI|nr:DUF1002 domain-containing protein [Virgibacillus natechei]MBP1970946.1 uncharacterized protein YpuA (DUF1002 family) [Virgibacillus natechei]UZD12714.1 DUF1002 domain-containing protein [Virgibacillus natechei]
MKYQLKIAFLFLLVVGLITGMSTPVQATSANIIVYGEQLTEDQRAEVRDILEITDSDAVEEYDVTGQDYADFINGNPDSNMYSSAKITLEESGAGLTVNIVTPDNITEVANEMYANALLTAGVENATVDVASPVAVTGHSALTGIYKAYDVEGEELDKERMELANEELNVATDLAEEDGVSQEKVSELLSEIKQMIADQDPATREDVQQIVEEQLENLEISLDEADRQRLVDLFDQMQDLNINFDQVRNQLEDIASTVRDQIDQLNLDEGFWDQVRDFFQSIGNFFRGLFN